MSSYYLSMSILGKTDCYLRSEDRKRSYIVLSLIRFHVSESCYIHILQSKSTNCVEAEHKIKWELLTYLFNLRFRAQLNVVLAGVSEATSLFSTIGHRALQLR